MAVASLPLTKSRDDWSPRFDRWAQGPSATEKEKCENAERMVRAAIAAHDGLRARNIEVFAQGSYPNRTNVRLDSDVDICVLCRDTFYPDYSFVPAISNSTFGFPDATYGFDELKRDVEAALVATFGRKAVTAGDKAFDIKENTYRVAADVVPTFEGRLYYGTGAGDYQSGTILQCRSDGRLIRNWPKQHYANGVQRHTQTSRQFKKKARCLKNLCNAMADADVASAKGMSSFLLESLVYNCPDAVFTQPSHYDDVKEAIRHLYHATQTAEACREMTEVNGIKYLFHVTQPWTSTAVNTFLLDAWKHVGFGDA
jgi:hypothetical protein